MKSINVLAGCLHGQNYVLLIMGWLVKNPNISFVIN